jgi:hypothetical protein
VLVTRAAIETEAPEAEADAEAEEK